MAQTGFFHHVGTFLLFVATILLLVTTISAPVVDSLALLKVDLRNRQSSDPASITFGTFGFCLNNVAGDNHQDCSPRHVGYFPADVLQAVDNTDFSDPVRKTTNALTKVMVLHPVACVLNFIAFLLALGAGMVGSFLASLVALLAFIVTVVVMIVDFVLFSIVKNHVNDDPSGSVAEYGNAAWTILVSAICSLLGVVVVFLTCCSARLHKKRGTKASTSRRWI